MLLCPAYPGAAWLPKFEGTEGETRYKEWRTQVRGLLGAQDLTEDKKVAILMSMIAGDAKRELTVLEAGQRDTVARIIGYLDQLYRKPVPASQRRVQFYSCTQQTGESMSAYSLRLRELFGRLRRLDPDTAPTGEILRDQLIMGLAEGPVQRALRIHARRNPTDGFLALREEAIALEQEFGEGTQQTEITCHAVNPASVPPPAQNWQQELKQEIMGEVRKEMKELTRELTRDIIREFRPSQPTAEARARTPSPEPRPSRFVQRQASQTRYEWDVDGRPICSRCRRPGHMARSCRSGQVPLN